MPPASQGYTLCTPLKRVFLALVSSPEGWMGWTLQLRGSREPHGMEASVLLCGPRPGLWIWVACLQKGVTSQGASLPHLLVSGEKAASLEKQSTPLTSVSPGLSFSTFKLSHRAYGAERYLFPDLSGVSPVG